MQIAPNARTITRPRPLPRFLIANPRLEFSLNNGKQTHLKISNRERMAISAVTGTATRVCSRVAESTARPKRSARPLSFQLINTLPCLRVKRGEDSRVFSALGNRRTGELGLTGDERVNRRDFLRSAGVVSAGLVFSRAARLSAQAMASETWRTFDVITRVEVLKSSGTTRIWVPAALINQTPFQKTLSNTFNADGGAAKLLDSQASSLGIIAAEFPPGVKPILTVTSRVTTKNFAVDLSAPGKAPQTSRADLDYFLRPSKLQPNDGIVKETSMEITKGATTDVDKARAIYEWIVDNTFRNPKTRGCGLG